MLVEETTVPLSALPVAEFTDHLRLGSGFADDGLQDALLARHLRASLAAIEARTGKALLERMFSWSLPGWRDAGRQPLPLAPVSAISEVRFIDQQGAETLVDADLWYLELDTHRPALLPTGTCLPAVPAGGTVRVGLMAGYGPEWRDLPADLAQAVLLLAAHFYEFRHEAARGAPALPMGVQSLIEPYRTVRLLMGGRA